MSKLKKCIICDRSVSSDLVRPFLRSSVCIASSCSNHSDLKLIRSIYKESYKLKKLSFKISLDGNIVSHDLFSTEVF